MRKIKFSPGEIYHIYNRGNNKRPIFHDERDMWRFLQGLALFNYGEDSSYILWQLESRKEGANMRSLKEFIERKRDGCLPLVNIMADCLMSNHFHLILKEVQDGGISNFMHRLGTGYVSFFNKKYGNSGSLFQGTFKATHIDDDLYLRYLLVYINVLNPGQIIQPNIKERGPENIDAIMKFAEEYQWSTNPEYLQIRKSFFIEKGVLGRSFTDPDVYKSFAQTVLQGKKYNQISDLIME